MLTPGRERLLGQIASELEKRLDQSVLMVGIDGVDGAGKTWFANELAARVHCAPVIRASVDSFHNPRVVRYAQGKTSPDGYFEDSFNYTLLKNMLLNPLRAGAGRRYRTAAFDHVRNEPVDAPVQVAQDPSVLIFDGIFLHRPEWPLTGTIPFF